MQFLRALSIAALTFAATVPVAQASIVTLEFDLTPTSISTATGSHGLMQMTPTRALTDAEPFSVTVQLDSEVLHRRGYNDTGPSFHIVASSYLNETAVIERPSYVDHFNQVLPYDTGLNTAKLLLSRRIDTSTPTAVPLDILTVDAQLSRTIYGSAINQISNLRTLSLYLLAPSASDALSSTELNPYLGNDAVVWLQALQSLTVVGGFGDELELTEHRLIPNGPDGSWVVDKSNAGILSKQTIYVTGDVRLRSVTVVVPEPATSVLAGIGVVALLAATRRPLKAF